MAHHHHHHRHRHRHLIATNSSTSSHLCPRSRCTSSFVLPVYQSPSVLASVLIQFRAVHLNYACIVGRIRPGAAWVPHKKKKGASGGRTGVMGDGCCQHHESAAWRLARKLDFPYNNASEGYLCEVTLGENLGFF